MSDRAELIARVGEFANAWRGQRTTTKLVIYNGRGQHSPEFALADLDALLAALDSVSPPTPVPTQGEEAREGCGGCIRCSAGVQRFESSGLFRAMVVCAECGNKRCPHASDHRLPCSGSNEPGQPGSVYA